MTGLWEQQVLTVVYDSDKGLSHLGSFEPKGFE